MIVMMTEEATSSCLEFQRSFAHHRRPIPADPPITNNLQIKVQESSCSDADTSSQSQPSSSSNYLQYLVQLNGRHRTLHSVRDSEEISAGSSKAVSSVCQKTVSLKTGRVASLALSKGVLYSGSEGNCITMWQQPNLEKILECGSGHGIVKCLLVAGHKMFSTHQDNKVRVWEISKCHLPGNKPVPYATLPTIKNYLTALLLPQNIVQVRRHKTSFWIKHIDNISALATGHNDLLYTGSWDRSVKVWKISSLKCLESFKAHDDAVNAIIISKSGHVYTGSADAKVKIWERNSKKHMLFSVLEGHSSSVNALAISPDESLLYSASSDRRILIWEREESARHMSHLGTLRGHRQAVLSLASSADLLCSGSTDKTIRVWRRNEDNFHQCIWVLEGHAGPVKALSISQDTENAWFVYSGSLDGQIKEWWLSLSSKICFAGEESFYSGKTTS
ncbi:hypothetical protein O6H91_04G084200 [Diphasiastrum complanatum]|uniref:Uncharacterized protein n=1 Tax=Diphasiastrum complanatum TaxID=34168 RepID=A0ACC2DYX1_DIPCM|nr:hypothetical protein O6H91_04G084200 [Diphasiastrum complanatum]